MTDDEKRMADREAAIESKDSRTRALLKEKEERIIRVCLTYLYCICALNSSCSMAIYFGRPVTVTHRRAYPEIKTGRPETKTETETTGSEAKTDTEIGFLRSRDSFDTITNLRG